SCLEETHLTRNPSQNSFVSCLSAFCLPHVVLSNRNLGEQLLLVRLHVDVALGLGAGGADLEADAAGLDALAELLQALDAAVLHRVLEARSEVGDELADGTRE